MNLVKVLNFNEIQCPCLSRKTRCSITYNGYCNKQEIFYKVQQIIHAKEMACFSLYDLQFIDYDSGLLKTEFLFSYLQ